MSKSRDRRSSLIVFVAPRRRALSVTPFFATAVFLSRILRRWILATMKCKIPVESSGTRGASARFNLSRTAGTLFLSTLHFAFIHIFIRVVNILDTRWTRFRIIGHRRILVVSPRATQTTAENLLSLISIASIMSVLSRIRRFLSCRFVSRIGDIARSRETVESTTGTRVGKPSGWVYMRTSWRCAWWRIFVQVGRPGCTGYSVTAAVSWDPRCFFHSIALNFFVRVFRRLSGSRHFFLLNDTDFRSPVPEIRRRSWSRRWSASGYHHQSHELVIRKSIIGIILFHAIRRLGWFVIAIFINFGRKPCFLFVFLAAWFATCASESVCYRIIHSCGHSFVTASRWEKSRTSCRAKSRRDCSRAWFGCV